MQRQVFGRDFDALWLDYQAWLEHEFRPQIEALNAGIDEHSVQAIGQARGLRGRISGLGEGIVLRRQRESRWRIVLPQQ